MQIEHVDDMGCFIMNKSAIYDFPYCISYSYPEIKRVNTEDVEFYFMESEKLVVSKIENFTSFNGGTITNKYMRFSYVSELSKVIGRPFEETFAFYSEKSPLKFVYVPNHTSKGVITAKNYCSKEENLLISSGALSGCTTCSLYLKELNIIYYFHVGGAQVVYPQSQKNTDLFNAIAKVLNMDEIEKSQLSDTQLLERLYRLLTSSVNKTQINIYISSKEGDKNKNGSLSWKNANTNINISYYKKGAQMLITLSKDKIYSVHYYSHNDHNDPYKETKRKNYIILP